jgi:Novel toxin 15
MGNIDVPKTLDATGVLHMGLQLVGGSPQQLEQKLIAQVPGGMAAINAAGEAKTAFSSIQKDGFAPTVKKYYEGADLQSTIVSGVKQYVIGSVVKQGLTMLASLFIPGAGIIQAAIKLYETIKFIWDKMKDIAATVNAITSSFAEIAAGNVTSAAGKVTTSLVGMLGLAVGFLARLARLDGIGAWVQKKLEPIKTAISNAWNKFVTWFKGLVSKGGSKPSATDARTKGDDKPTTENGSPKPQLLKDVVSGVIAQADDFELDSEKYRTWVQVTKGNADFILNPSPTEARLKLQGYQTKLNNRDARAQTGDTTAGNVQPYLNNASSIVNDGEADLQRRLNLPNSRAARQGLTDVARNYARRLAGVYKTIETSLRTGSQYDYPFVTDATGVRRMKPVSIGFSCPRSLVNRGLKAEFDRQVQGQQTGLNRLPVQAWFTNRSSYLAGGRSNAEQERYRDDEEFDWKERKRLELQSKPWPSALTVEVRQVRPKFAGILSTAEILALNDPTIVVSDEIAEKVTNLIWSQQAALHDPDQVAGGRADGLTGFGDKDANSAIGGQWPLPEGVGGTARITKLDSAVAKVPQRFRAQLRMNVTLRS